MANQEEEILGKAYDGRLMRRLLTYLRPYSWQVIVALVSIILKAGLDVLGPFLTKTAIDKYLSHTTASISILDRWLSSVPMKGIAQLSLLYVGTLVLSFLFEFLQTYYMQWTGQMVMFDLRSQIFRHLQRMHIGFYDRNPVGRLVTRVTSDVDALNEMFTAGVVSIFEDVFVLLYIIAIMMTMNWKVALMTLAVLPFITWATMIFRVKVRDSYRRIRVAIARINSYLQEAVSGMLVLQLFNREKRAYQQFSKVNASHMEAFKDAIMAYAVYYPVVEVLSQIAVATIVWFGGREVIQHVRIASIAFDFSRQHIPVVRIIYDTATIGVLFAFTQYALRFFRPIQDLSDKYNILQSAMASSERIFKLLDTPVDITSPEITKRPEGPGRIEFDHVWFSYGVRGTAADSLTKTQPNETPSSDSSSSTAELDWVLRDVSFTIEPGETIAVVGHTGAGKTTLISLLLRFYDVQKGAIRIDGVDIKDMDLNDLRRRFGVVLQDPFLFSGTVGGNIRLGSDWIADADVEKAAEEVNLGDFIRTLPGGFGEEVRERGSTLSTGQKQLISFARALAHNPQILILDEATSSVDTETEFRVRDALSRMVQGRTSLVIAHRLSTIQRADKIIVMHKGKVREMGTHQQLLAQRGVYYKLYQLQYKDQEVPVASSKTPEVTASADVKSCCSERCTYPEIFPGHVGRFKSRRHSRPRLCGRGEFYPGSSRTPDLPRLYNGHVGILISAGEASGEMYGAQLIEALRRRDPSLEFFGVGGQRMRDAGCDTIIDASDLAVVGITEILGHLPKIYGLFNKLIAEADRREPDLAIVIDSPAFNWRVARQMKKRGIPVIYYVAPQFWAWRQGRVRLLRKYVTKALVIFPFEEQFYRDRGVDASFVGHPLAELPPAAVTREAYAAQYQLALNKCWITIMPGSRVKEVRMNLPTMLDAAALLGAGYEFLLPVAPTLDRDFLEESTRARGITLVDGALPALQHARAAIVASGTATVEAAMMATPFVMVYRVSSLTYVLGKPRIKVPYFAMVNLIAGAKIVPELVQDEFTAERVVSRVKELLSDGKARTTMLEGLARVKARLRSPDSGDARSAAERAADTILACVSHRV